MLRIGRIVNDSARPMLRNKRGSARRGGLRGTVLLPGLLSACHPMLQELRLSGDAGEASKWGNTDATSRRGEASCVRLLFSGAG